MVGRDASPEAALALGLAARLDDPGTSAAAAAQLAGRLLDALAVIRERAPVEVSPLDEIRARRDRRAGRAASKD